MTEILRCVIDLEENREVIQIPSRWRFSLNLFFQGAILSDT